jgi:hypothetical protein
MSTVQTVLVALVALAASCLSWPFPECRYDRRRSDIEAADRRRGALRAYGGGVSRHKAAAGAGVGVSAMYSPETCAL